MKKIAVLLLLVLVLAGCFTPDYPMNRQDDFSKNNNLTYTITFNGNGGVTSDNKETYTQTFTKDIPITLLKNTFVRDGYIFKGWSESKDNFKTIINDQAEYSTSKNVILYAVWEIIPAVVENINVELLSNTQYHMYDTFDKANLKVTAKMSDGALLNISDYTTDFDTVILTAGKNKPVTVKYKDKTAVFTINVSYKFCETIKRLPHGTNGTAGTSGSYLYFGDYPQTIKNNNVVIDHTPIAINGWTVYLGSDDYYYVKVRENGLWSNFEYSDGTHIKSFDENSERYFKIEPIKWSVVTDSYYDTGNALIVAEKALTANIPYYIDLSNRTIKSKTIYPNNYMYSSIRAFLNGRYENDDVQPKDYNGKGFLQTAFSSKAQDNILTTSVVNNGFSTGDNTTFPPIIEYTCENTNDKIFLLSRVDAELLKTDDERERIPTDYAKANYADYSRAFFNGSDYWLRSPYSHPFSATDTVKAQTVLWHGRINKPGSKVNVLSFAVVPAMTVHF